MVLIGSSARLVGGGGGGGGGEACKYFRGFANANIYTLPSHSRGISPARLSLAYSRGQQCSAAVQCGTEHMHCTPAMLNIRTYYYFITSKINDSLL